jgi:hypothetical protein
MKPQLLVDAKPEVRGNIPFSEEARKLVLEGMRVTADVGTAKVLRRTDAVIGGSFVRDAAIIGFSANEAISIVENAGLMGLPIPAAITKAIDILKQRAETPEKGKD